MFWFTEVQQNLPTFIFSIYFSFSIYFQKTLKKLKIKIKLFPATMIHLSSWDICLILSETLSQIIRSTNLNLLIYTSKKKCFQFPRGHPQRLSDFLGNFLTHLPTHDRLSLYTKCNSMLSISDFYKPTYLSKNRIFLMDASLSAEFSSKMAILRS